MVPSRRDSALSLEVPSRPYGPESALPGNIGGKKREFLAQPPGAGLCSYADCDHLPELGYYADYPSTRPLRKGAYPPGQSPLGRARDTLDNRTVVCAAC